ncbi:mannose-6-phosphate isomerase, class I [Vibrio cionasavignyae]|uniref:mannose-6-phosphate isomerase, class I n=1 Tax=Vibrio cionasavignyae TaxID=2910252 RepID=UPI003D0E0E52
MSDFSIADHVVIQRIFYPMTNVIQNYAWGSPSSFGLLFGTPNPSGEPQAEIWMGAHPNGCSTVMSNNQETKLSSLISRDSSLFLSESIANRFGELPYLFKVLAAEKALSVQVHPNKQQAEQGYALEEQRGVPLTAGNRNYKDANHKPELVYALTDYTAMNGFRPISDILEHFMFLDIAELNSLVNDLSGDPTPNGLSAFFSGLLSLQGEQKEAALMKLLMKTQRENGPVFALIAELEQQYPGDVGLFTPLLLNVVTLQPGQAMYLDAETPHAYIKGTGLEIMANSDNVLRAGLTPKFMDVNELVSCTRFDEKPADHLLLAPTAINGVLEYPIPVDDFNFSIMQHSQQRQIKTKGPEILLPLDEAMTLSHQSGETCVINKGHSVFIPAYADNYTINCSGRVARAYS